MIGKVIWLGLVWLLYPYAMVPYIYESIHPIKLQVIHLLKKDMSEPGTRDCSNAWWHLGDKYGGSPPKRLTFDTQQPIDARDRSRWWTDRCRLSYPSLPPPHISKTHVQYFFVACRRDSIISHALSVSMSIACSGLSFWYYGWFLPLPKCLPHSHLHHPLATYTRLV